VLRCLGLKRHVWGCVAAVELVTVGCLLGIQGSSTIANIVSQVRGVTELVARIANASDEQASGIRQIGQAVEQLDRMIQVNSSLVQGHTAVANNLKAQTERLVETLSVFTLSRGEVTLLQARPR
jgi:aerotaxis receptor